MKVLKFLFEHCRFHRVPDDVGDQIVPVAHLRTASRVLRSMRPPSVENLRSLHEKIRDSPLNEFIATKQGERLSSFWFADSNTLFVTSRRQLNSLSTANMIQCDATYGTRPQGLCRQLFTVHGHWGGHVSHSVGSTIISNIYLHDPMS